MKTKITSFVAFLLLGFSVFVASAQNVELTKLGTAGLAVDGDSTSASYTQSLSNLVFTGFSGGSNLLAGFFAGAPLNWSSYTISPYTNFALNMSSSGTNPETDFTIDLYSSTGIVDSFTGSTSGLTGSLSLVNLSLSVVGNKEYNDIMGIGFSWNGTLASPNTVTVESVYAVVPEPSTYALLALSGLALGGYTIRRRRRV